MNNDYWGPFAAAGIIGLVISLLLSAGAIALGIWITYTIIWRAVRRGLREFHRPGQQ